MTVPYHKDTDTAAIALGEYIPYREVPEHWTRELEAIVPRSDQVSWLKIVWHPGHPTTPLNRWVIYELQPRLDLVHPDRLADIRGPAPRTVGRWIPDPSVPGGKRWKSDSQHSQVQWDLFRETNCYPVLFWIIQGEHGGHPWRLSQAQRRFALSQFGPDFDVPNPGDLPYAEWDERVANAVRAADRLRKWEAEHGSDWTARTDDKDTAYGHIVREENAENEALGVAALKRLDTEIEDAVRDIPRRMLPGMSDLPMGDPHYNADAETLERALIEGASVEGA